MPHHAVYAQDSTGFELWQRKEDVSSSDDISQLKPESQASATGVGVSYAGSIVPFTSLPPAG